MTNTLREVIADDIVAALRAGGTVLFPTETVVGLACLAQNDAAVQRLFAIKRRPPDRALPLQVDRVEAWQPLCRRHAAAEFLAHTFWPGPLTVVAPLAVELPSVVTGGRDTVGVRIPDHPLALALLAAVGAPLAVTSANLSDSPAPCCLAEVSPELRAAVDAVADDGSVGSSAASTVIECNNSGIRILRQGELTREQIDACANDEGVRISWL